jgi:glucosamine--fructose-6-phosphate aminotransferase (isomerizing)
MTKGMSQMQTTMQTQPDELRRLVADREPAQAAAERIAGRRTWLVGIGTSWHAAHHGAWLLGEAGVDAYALHAADAVPYRRRFEAADAVIVLSHTGQTGYTAQARDAAREAGATVVHVTGVGKGGDVETVAPETSYAYTASHTGGLCAWPRSPRRSAPTSATSPRCPTPWGASSPRRGPSSIRPIGCSS